MKSFLSLCLVCTIFIAACHKKCGETCPGGCNPDYFEFGYYGGFMGVHKFFVIKNAQLYPEDSTKPALSVSQYDSARRLIEDFPAYLWAHPNQTFGCPGCADTYVAVLTWKKDGSTYTWSIDEAADSLPVELKNYLAELGRIANQF